MLAAGPQSADDMAAQCGAHGSSLYRLLRALAADGIFAEREDGRFELTPAADSLRKDAPDSQHAMAIMLGQEHYRAYGELLYSVQTGEKGFDKLYGMPIFDFLGQHAEQAAIFDAAMSSIHGREAAPMLRAYDFGAASTVADIGGGNGSTLMAVLHKHENVRGILFDLPHVNERARPHIEDAGLAEQCQLATGNFFDAVPGGADIYMMRHIIQDWNDQQAATILRNCRAALAPGGKVLVLESIISPGNEPMFAKWLDLTMLVMAGGRERTEAQFRELFASAGLKLARIVPTAGEISILEAVPAE
jgi:hypothetical protein